MIRGTVLTDHESLISRCSFLSMLPKPPSNRTIFFSLLKSFHVFVSQSTLDQTGTGQNSAYVARQGATGLTCNLRVGWPRTVGHIQQVISLFMLPPCLGIRVQNARPLIYRLLLSHQQSLQQQHLLSHVCIIITIIVQSQRHL